MKLRGQPLHLRLYGTGVNMGVIVQRHGDVGVAHDVLQSLGIHTAVGHTGTERMPIEYNKDKSENPVFSRVLTICPYSFSIQNGLIFGSL